MTWHRYAIWDEWKSLTRFTALVDYSLETSATLWKALPIRERDAVTLVRPEGGSKFACPGSSFLPILEDRHTIASLLILSSYALIEAHVDDVLEHMAASGITSIQLVNDYRSGLFTAQQFCSRGGVETWGQTLLSSLGRDWSEVLDGKAGAVEVATVRNAIAHGKKHVDQSMINRVNNANGTLPWGLGDAITLNLALTRIYRDRLRSFARVVGSAAHTTAYP